MISSFFAKRASKHVGKSLIYKNVYIKKRCDNGELFYCGNIKRRTKYFTTEREAAIYVDLVLIDNNLPPINILKPKK
jgi:hypothetical protein